MTEPSEAAFSRADGLSPHGNFRLALALLIQQMSDAAKDAQGWTAVRQVHDRLAPFILPEPVDPLVEVLVAMAAQYPASPVTSVEHDAVRFRETLAKHGLKIVKDETALKGERRD